MLKHPARLFTTFVGIFLLVQGTSTLLFRLVPSLDRAFPQLLAVTHMVSVHSMLHIVTGAIAIIILGRGGERGPLWFAAGFGLFYTALAIYGFLTGTPTIFHLQPFDHPFHLLIGVWGLVAAFIEYQKRK